MTEFRLGDYLDHIDQAATEALEFVRGQTRDEFCSDRRTQQAVIMNLIVVGEASVCIAEKYPDFVAQNPHIAWRDIRGMRNRIVHGYFDINLDVVWAALQSAIPQLLIQIQDLKKIV